MERQHDAGTEEMRRAERQRAKGKSDNQLVVILPKGGSLAQMRRMGYLKACSGRS